MKAVCRTATHHTVAKMNSVVVVFLAALVACAHAQKGSVHCGVGCACSRDQEPVCANDGVTYLNECELRCAQCNLQGVQLSHYGACPGRGFASYAPPAQTEYGVPLVCGWH